MNRRTAAPLSVVVAALAVLAWAPVASAQPSGTDPYVGGTTVVTTSLPPGPPPTVLGEAVSAGGGRAPVVLAAGQARPAAAQVPAATLAMTGGDITSLVLAGSALAATGLAVLALRRRRPAL